MRRLVLRAPNSDMEQVDMQLEEVPVPKPKHGEVLVRVAAAPVNPSDYGEWRMSREGKVGLGKEGSGLVVASGGGWMANRLVGKRVGIFPPAGGKQSQGVGTYQEYACCSAMLSCFPLPETVRAASRAVFAGHTAKAYGIYCFICIGTHSHERRSRYDSR